MVQPHTPKRTAIARRNLQQVLNSFYMMNNAEVRRSEEKAVLERKGLAKSQHELDEEEKRAMLAPPKGASEFIRHSNFKQMVDSTFGHLITKQTGIADIIPSHSANER